VATTVDRGVSSVAVYQGVHVPFGCGFVRRVDAARASQSSDDVDDEVLVKRGAP
jgi:hypothetical protein